MSQLNLTPTRIDKQEISFLACVVAILKDMGITFCLDGELIAPAAETDGEGEE